MPGWPQPFAKMSGGGALPPRPGWGSIAFAGVGAGIAAGVLMLLGEVSGAPLVAAPLGATILLVFVFPESPLAQPRSILGGYLIAGVISIALAQAFPGALWPLAPALALSTMAMAATRMLHAPAGALPALLFLEHPEWMFLLTPVMSGALAVIAVGLVINNLSPGRRWPSYW